MLRTSVFVQSFATKGKGKAWVAEAHKPWVAGDTTCATYLQPLPGSPDVYELEYGPIYRCHEPIPFAGSKLAPNFSYRRYYVTLDAEGAVIKLTDPEAEHRLTELNNARVKCAQLEFSVVVAGQTATFKSTNGRTTTVFLSIDTLAKLRRLGDDNGF